MSPKLSIYNQAYSAVQKREYGFARRLLAQLLCISAEWPTVPPTMESV